MRLGVGDLVAVDDGVEERTQAGGVEHEVDVERLCVGGDGQRDAASAGGAEQLARAGDEVFLQDGRHHLAVEPLLGRAVLEHDVFGNLSSENVVDDLVVALAEHAVDDGGVLDSVTLEVRDPGLGVKDGGVDQHAVHVEDDGQAGGECQFFKHKPG